jgi:2'-5' RNA ligase
MGFRFLAADKVTDPASAERVLTKYKNREASMSLDSQSFEGTVLQVKASGGTLRVEFTWNRDQDQDLSDIEHTQRYAKSRVGSMVRFKVGTDEFTGLLSGLTELPEGATIERYVDSPFVLTFAFTANDQRPLISAGSEQSGIIGVPVPENVAEKLPLDENLPYEPHITVCFFPKLTKDDVEKLLPLAVEAAGIVGSFDVQIDGTTTFPTPQEDGTYPYVARIKSQGLVDFHDLFVEMCEHQYPGMVDTTFALKNYTPHLTLHYSKSATNSAPVPAMAWNVDHLTLNLGREQKFPIPLTEGSVREGSVATPYFQLGEIQIPVHVVSNKDGDMRIRLKDSNQAAKFDDMEGEKVLLVTKNAEREIEIVEIRESGPDGFQLFYRTLVTYMPKSSAAKLRYVGAVAMDRGLLRLAAKLSNLLDFEEAAEDEAEDQEPEDKEALGPGFEGTDEHIVTYVKAPQTQVIVEEPKFTRKLPLHERI